MIIEVKEFITAPVDQSLLLPCEPVIPDFETNGELLDGFLEANKRLENCNSDKDALRRLLDGPES